MSPINPHVASQLRQLIYYHLDCNLLRNALFLSGRLHAYEPRSPEAAYLLSLCQLRMGQLKAALDSSRGAGSRGAHLGCSYVFAQACLALGRHLEGITALDKSKGLWATRSGWNKHSESRRQSLPDASAIISLQGKLWHAHGDTDKAIECYAEALRLNPFMWDAFLGLCDIGVNVRMSNIFKMTPEMIGAMTVSPNEETLPGVLEYPPTENGLQHQNSNESQNQPPPSQDPFSISKNRVNADINSSFSSSALFEKLNGSNATMTPVGEVVDLGHVPIDSPTGFGEGAEQEQRNHSRASGMIETKGPKEPPQAPMRKSRTLQGLGMDFSIGAPPKMRSTSIKSKMNNESEDSIISNVATTKVSDLAARRDVRKRTVSGQVASQLSSGLTSSSRPIAEDSMAPQRKSVRLLNQLGAATGRFSSSTGTVGSRDGKEVKKARATGTKGRNTTTSTVGRVVSGNRKHCDQMDVDGKETRVSNSAHDAVVTSTTKPASNGKTKEYEGLQWLLELFMKLGSGYFALSHYRCQDALQIFNSISPSQRETPWVLAQIGRAFYEQASYADAEKYFSRIRAIAPARLEDMEVYSTILWHNKSEIDLAFLAHELVDINRHSPQAWCAIGNSFSLQRDHDQALKCFKRATQLDSKFAYAFTLQGHEHVANEEYDKALASYRYAIAAENRHYNAWYGLGKVFEKQGKYEIAEKHYRTAAAINPANAVLICCIGVMLEKLKNPKAALLHYTRACDLAPKSALTRFKKAKVLMAMNEPQLALVELRILKDVAPDEANVHFLLGSLYKGLRQKGNAIKHFTTALNLDPKASQHIREAMEQMEDDDDEVGGMD